MKNKSESLGESEIKAIKSLEKEFKEHNEFSLGVYNLISEAISKLPVIAIKKLPKSRLASTLIICRISNDLRCVALLAKRGYTAQALTLAASVYEASFTVDYIADNDNIAQEWLKHNDPIKFFKEIYFLTREAVAKRDVSDVNKQADKLYKIYRQFCWAKHINPVFQKLRNIDLSNFTMFTGPDTSDTSIRDGWFALEHASSSALTAIDSFIIYHIPELERSTLRQKLKKLELKRIELNNKARQRWGNQDPFPGK